jgi:hypothetical protein
MSGKIEKQILEILKPLIETLDLESLTEEYNTLVYDTEYPREVDWAYVLQKCYLHACLKKKPQIASWMEGLFSLFDPIQQIAYRQTFAYGRILLQK